MRLGSCSVCLWHAFSPPFSTAVWRKKQYVQLLGLVSVERHVAFIDKNEEKEASEKKVGKRPNSYAGWVSKRT